MQISGISAIVQGFEVTVCTIFTSENIRVELERRQTEIAISGRIFVHFDIVSLATELKLSERAPSPIN